MNDMEKRDRVAKALFCGMYENDCADDPTFPDRVWASMSEEQRVLYYRQAEIAIAAGA
jgi:hypothetical protein